MKVIKSNGNNNSNNDNNNVSIVIRNEPKGTKRENMKRILKGLYDVQLDAIKKLSTNEGVSVSDKQLQENGRSRWMELLIGSTPIPVFYPYTPREFLKVMEGKTEDRTKLMDELLGGEIKTSRAFGMNTALGTVRLSIDDKVDEMEEITVVLSGRVIDGLYIPSLKEVRRIDKGEKVLMNEGELKKEGLKLKNEFETTITCRDGSQIKVTEIYGLDKFTLVLEGFEKFGIDFYGAMEGLPKPDLILP